MRGKNMVAIILAVGIATAVNAITFGVLYDAIVNPGDAGLSENGTTVLTTAFGGIIGVLGSYVGFRGGEKAYQNGVESATESDEDS